jgi:hypothetical protein
LTRELTNDYWEAVRTDLEHDDFSGGQVVDSYGSLRFRTTRTMEPNRADRHELTSRYSWTITDPDTVAFVVKHCGLNVVDPMAGSGWWAHLLTEAGVMVQASDENPPDGTEANMWHRGGSHVPVARADAATGVDLAPAGSTLLLSWPPYDSDAGYRALRAYRGDAVVYIGEGYGGCCGDDAMFDLFTSDFEQVAEHRPVQFYGLHDWVTVYRRKRNR